MKLHLKLIIVVFSVSVFTACVKNTPFIQPFSVPPSYTVETNDSAALARVIMTYGLYNYLSNSVNTTIDTAIIDSLWLNTGAQFTTAMVPDFVYSAALLNGMTSINIGGSTSDADTINSFADSVAVLSQNYNVTASNGVAGTQTQQTPVMAKRLFNQRGMEMQEVWFNAMLGANFMVNVNDNLAGPGQNVNESWDLAYRYMGFPLNYDPAFNYNTTPIPTDRPLGIAALFPGVGNLNSGPIIYEEFRKAKAAALAGDVFVNAGSAARIAGYTELTLAQTAVLALDSVKQIQDPVAQLHYLSKAYGLVRGLLYRNLNISALSAGEYWQLREMFDVNFYDLISDASYTAVNEIENFIITAYEPDTDS